MSRHVVVSGGGTGIGLATATAFAEAGDRVTILGRRRAGGGRLVPLEVPDPTPCCADDT